MRIIYEGNFCDDCLYYSANGTARDGYDDQPERDARIAKAHTDRWPDGYVTPACGDDCEGWFSWTACQACGDTDGGTRHPFAVLPAPRAQAYSNPKRATDPYALPDARERARLRRRRRQ